MKKHIFWSLVFLVLFFLCLYGIILFSLYYVDGPGFKTLTTYNKTLDNKQKGDEKVVLKFVTVGHLMNGNYRRDLPPDHKGYPRHGLNKIVTHELDGQDYFADNFIKALPEIKDLDPDILFITGDVLPLFTIDIFERDDGIIDFAKERKIIEYCWDMIIPVLEETADDIIIAPGNHDIYGTTAEMVFREKVEKLFFSFTKKNIRFVVLNSVLKDTTGAYYDKWAWPVNIPQEQINFLRNGLTSVWKEDLIFIFLHHSPMDIPNWMNEIHPLLIGSNCQAVFSGTRFGTFGSDKKDGIMYLDGGFDYNFRYNPSYFVLTEVYGNGKIQHRIHYVLPSKISNKVKVLWGTIGSFLYKIYNFAKKHFIISLFWF